MYVHTLIFGELIQRKNVPVIRSSGCQYKATKTNGSIEDFLPCFFLLPYNEWYNQLKQDNLVF